MNATVLQLIRTQRAATDRGRPLESRRQLRQIIRGDGLKTLSAPPEQSQPLPQHGDYHSMLLAYLDALIDAEAGDPKAHEIADELHGMITGEGGEQNEGPPADPQTAKMLSTLPVEVSSVLFLDTSWQRLPVGSQSPVSGRRIKSQHAWYDPANRRIVYGADPKQGQTAGQPQPTPGQPGQAKPQAQPTPQPGQQPAPQSGQQPQAAQSVTPQIQRATELANGIIGHITNPKIAAPTQAHYNELVSLCPHLPQRMRVNIRNELLGSFGDGAAHKEMLANALRHYVGKRIEELGGQPKDDPYVKAHGSVLGKDDLHLQRQSGQVDRVGPSQEASIAPDDLRKAAQRLATAKTDEERHAARADYQIIAKHAQEQQSGSPLGRMEQQRQHQDQLKQQAESQNKRPLRSPEVNQDRFGGLNNAALHAIASSHEHDVGVDLIREAKRELDRRQGQKGQQPEPQRGRSPIYVPNNAEPGKAAKLEWDEKSNRWQPADRVQPPQAQQQTEFPAAQKNAQYAQDRLQGQPPPPPATTAQPAQPQAQPKPTISDADKQAIYKKLGANTPEQRAAADQLIHAAPSAGKPLYENAPETPTPLQQPQPTAPKPKQEFPESTDNVIVYDQAAGKNVSLSPEEYEKWRHTRPKKEAAQPQAKAPPPPTPGPDTPNLDKKPALDQRPEQQAPEPAEPEPATLAKPDKPAKKEKPKKQESLAKLVSQHAAERRKAHNHAADTHNAMLKHAVDHVNMGQGKKLRIGAGEHDDWKAFPEFEDVAHAMGTHSHKEHFDTVGEGEHDNYPQQLWDKIKEGRKPRMTQAEAERHTLEEFKNQAAEHGGSDENIYKLLHEHTKKAHARAADGLRETEEALRKEQEDAQQHSKESEIAETVRSGQEASHREAQSEEMGGDAGARGESDDAGLSGDIDFDPGEFDREEVTSQQKDESPRQQEEKGDTVAPKDSTQEQAEMPTEAKPQSAQVQTAKPEKVPVDELVKQREEEFAKGGGKSPPSTPATSMSPEDEELARNLRDAADAYRGDESTAGKGVGRRSTHQSIPTGSEQLLAKSNDFDKQLQALPKDRAREVWKKAYDGTDAEFETTHTRWQTEKATRERLAQDDERKAAEAKAERDRQYEEGRPAREAQWKKNDEENARIREQMERERKQREEEGKNAPVAKQPHEVTRSEFESSFGGRPGKHRMYVKGALDEGRNVPPEVLKDYPDLAKKYGGAQGKPKEPHEMTEAEWDALPSSDKSKHPRLESGPNTSHTNYHQMSVLSAIQDGKPVPPHVLADYPELANAKPSKFADVRGEAEELKAKEPHEMTREEWQNSPEKDAAESAWDKDVDADPNLGFAELHKRHPFVRREHEDLVRNALAAGKPVPPEVLADYPDLVKKPEPELAAPEVAKEPEKEAAPTVSAKTIGGETHTGKLADIDNGTAIIEKPDGSTHATPIEAVKAADAGAPGVSHNDIPYDTAYNAHRNSSMVPERRAKQRQQEYVDQMNADWHHLNELAKTPEHQKQIAEEFERYKKGYREKMLAVLHAASRTASSMITGPANFPTESNRKRLDTESKRIGELIDFRKRALAAIHKKIAPEDGAIQSNHPEAVQLLQKQLDDAKSQQELYKKMNDAHRRFLKDPASLDKSDLPDSVKEQIRNYKPAYSWEPNPIPPYRLQNNNASIKRIEKRLEEVSKMKAGGHKEQAYSGGVKVLEDPDAARIRIMFPGKPEKATIEKLKKGGFRWSPSEGAWQRHLNNAGRYAVDNVLKELGHEKVESPASDEDSEPELPPMLVDMQPEPDSPEDAKPKTELRRNIIPGASRSSSEPDRLDDEQKKSLASLAADAFKKNGTAGVGKGERRALVEQVIGKNANQKMLQRAVEYFQARFDDHLEEIRKKSAAQEMAKDAAAAGIPEHLYGAIEKAINFATTDGSFESATSERYPHFAREQPHGLEFEEVLSELRKRKTDLSEDADPDEVIGVVYDILHEAAQVEHDKWEDALPPERSAERADATGSYLDIRDHTWSALEDAGVVMKNGSAQSDSTYWRTAKGGQIRVANHPSGITAISSPDAEIRVDKLKSSKDVRKAIAEALERADRRHDDDEEGEQPVASSAEAKNIAKPDEPGAIASPEVSPKEESTAPQSGTQTIPPKTVMLRNIIPLEPHKRDEAYKLAGAQTPEQREMVDKMITMFTTKPEKKAAAAPSAPDSPELTTAIQEASELNKQLGDMDSAKADRIHAATEKAKSAMGTDDFLKWATKLLGFTQKGSKEAVAKKVRAFVDRLATSAAQVAGIGEPSKQLSSPPELRPALRPAYKLVFDKKKVNSPIKMLATEHAPVGGIVIAGQPFQGGEFIPSQVLAKATPAEKLAVSSSPKTLEQRANLRKEVKTRLEQMIHANNHIHPIKRQKYTQAMHAVLDQFTPAMLEHVGETVAAVRCYSSIPELTQKLFPDEPPESLAGGCWEFETGGHAKNGILHIDGGYGAEIEHQAEHHYAHEQGHAIDLNYRYSGTPEWEKAWEAEINRLDENGQPALSAYAMKGEENDDRPESEGFAEFIRLIGTGNREYARVVFPQCWSFLQKIGLI